MAVDYSSVKAIKRRRTKTRNKAEIRAALLAHERAAEISADIRRRAKARPIHLPENSIVQGWRERLGADVKMPRQAATSPTAVAAKRNGKPAADLKTLKAQLAGHRAHVTRIEREISAASS